MAVNEPGVTGEHARQGIPGRPLARRPLPWLSVTATGRREALDEAREVIAEWLDVPPDAFDVEAG